MRGFKQIGVGEVGILWAGMNWSSNVPEYTCQACPPLHETIWSIDKLPELPHPSWSGHYGCRCILAAIIQPQAIVSPNPLGRDSTRTTALLPDKLDLQAQSERPRNADERAELGIFGRALED